MSQKYDGLEARGNVKKQDNLGKFSRSAREQQAGFAILVLTAAIRIYFRDV